MVEKQLTDIRCPFQKRAKHSFYNDGKLIKVGELYNCNFLCVRVYPPSSGETICTKCKLTFEFEVTEQSVANTRIKVQSSK